MLDRAEYADFWTLKWSDVLRSNRKTIQLKGTHVYQHWLRNHIEKNTPFDEARFEKTLSRARRHVRQSRETVDARLLALLEDLRTERRGHRHSDRLIVKSGGRVFFLRTEEIDWVEAAGNYVRLHARSESHLLRESMKNMEARLDPNTFVRIHRSAIVNIDRVKELEPWFHGEYIVIMRDGTRLTASRVYSDRLSALIE